ncbi:MAG: Smr/MutS family protein [Pseudobdellovibrionaceae bacterium]|jgi:DNA-nicking Smr family endonuclease|nr:Smr/MutS family protein [Pseudobdellovibrionaceae bacterium]
MPENRKKSKSKNLDVTISPSEAGQEISDPDQELWECYIRDVVPLKGRGYEQASGGLIPLSPTMPAPSRNKRSYTPLIPDIALRHEEASRSALLSPTQLDRGMDQKFRKGLLPVDGRLDLHGYSVEVAFRIFLEFMTRHTIANSRCLLVITGKGRNKSTGLDTGAIRSEFPKWLGLPRFSGLILAHCNAPPHMGGSGAFLVLLRKSKTESKG